MRTLARAVPAKEIGLKAWRMKHPELTFPLYAAIVHLAAPLPVCAPLAGEVILDGQFAQPGSAGSQAAMRDLWMDHIFWARDAILSILSGNSRATAVAEQEPFHCRGPSKRTRTAVPSKVRVT